MTGVFQRFAISFNLLFVGCLVLIHFQPYDDHDLRNLLFTPDCVAPCFMNIQPGLTSAADAVRTLEGSEWVGQIQVGPYGILWRWNGRQPLAFQNLYPVSSEKYDGVIAFADGLVVNIILSSPLKLGDLYLALGPPQKIGSISIQHSAYVQMNIPFGDEAFMASVTIECPVATATYWQSSGRMMWLKDNVGDGNSTNWRDLLLIFRRYDC
ncbi:MAG: hypothetical protein R3E39_31110 [Anaerolineae bacterium]